MFNKRNLLGSILVKLYIFLRGAVNPVVNVFLNNKFKDVPEIDFEKDYVEKLTEDEMSKKIMSYPYKWDPKKGALDFTFLDPKFFFWDGLPYGRDCDDFSYIWYLYFRLLGLKAYQYVVVPGYDRSKAHVIAVVKSEDGKTYKIYDYHKVYQAESISKVMKKYFFAMYSGNVDKKGNVYKNISYARLRRSEPIDKIKNRCYNYTKRGELCKNKNL